MLFSNSAVYAFANLLQRGLTLFLLPIYTSYFTKAEFGAMDQIYNMVMILALITSFGLPHGLKRGFYLDNPTEVDREKLLGVLLVFLLPVMILVGSGLWIGSSSISQILFRSPDHINWIHLAVLFYIALSIQQLYVQVLRTNQEARRLASWSLITFAVVAGGNILFIMFWHLGLSGMLLANIIGFGFSGIALAIGFRKHMKLNFQLTRLAPLFAFGLPMLPSLLSRKVLEVSDRYIIPYFHSMDELGIYVMGNKITMIFDVLILVPFLYAWQPFFYTHSGNDKAPQIFASVTHYVFMMLCLVFLFISASQLWLLDFLGSGKFEDSAPVIFWLLLSKIFVGFQYCISTGIHLKKKLAQELIIMIFAAILNIVLNLLLIPPLKGVGAALATALSFLFFLIGTFVISQKNYPVPYCWLRMANVLIQTALAYLLMFFSPSLVLKYSIIVVFVFSCVYPDLQRHGEMRNLLELKGRFFKKKQEK